MFKNHIVRPLASGTLVALLAAIVSGCGGGGNAAESAGESTPAAFSAQAALGAKLFNDASLSASGKQACASCHVAAHAHAAENALPAQLGGPLLDLQGGRTSPSMDYLVFNTPFYFAADGTPTGGFFWDGRAGSLQEQAAGPFLNPVEMANASKAELVSRVAKADYAAEFKRVFGSDIFDAARTEEAYDRVTLAIQQYEREETAFHSFSSKYDQFLRGKAQLSAQETRGLALFNDPLKGNCIACHPSGKGADGSMPLFTDFTYDALGVPRNPALVANADPAFYDMGLCQRADLTARTDLCGAFKVPSLRNVAQRLSYFHNGRFTSLTDVVTFYVQRDTNPEKWYPLAADGTVLKFDDLPAKYRGNVNTTEVPYNRKAGDAPALTDAEIDDLVAFLKTLSDGYQP